MTVTEHSWPDHPAAPSDLVVAPHDWPALTPTELARARRAGQSKRWHAVGPDHLALGVADMDLPSPPMALQAIEDRLRHPILGYHRLLPTLPEQVSQWYVRHTGWKPDPDAMAVLPFGLKTAIRLLLETLADRNHPVVVLTPCYDGLRRVGRDATCGLVEVPLTRGPDLAYGLDIELLRARILATGARTLLLCNPHNPLGRVWSIDELRSLAGLAEELDLLVVSDEVHSPLTHPGRRHHPWPLVARHDRWAVASSLGKAFNVSGIAGSWLICGRPAERAPLLRALKSWGHHQGSLLGDQVMDACLRHGDDWLAERTALVQRLVQHARRVLARDAPSIGCAAPEAGYLLWLDLRRVVPASAPDDLSAYLEERCGLRLVAGARFGGDHAGFARMNVGTSWPVLDEALRRLGRLA